jgi:hypothetical protein
VFDSPGISAAGTPADRRNATIGTKPLIVADGSHPEIGTHPFEGQKCFRPIDDRVVVSPSRHILQEVVNIPLQQRFVRRVQLHIEASGVRFKIAPSEHACPAKELPRVMRLVNRLKIIRLPSLEQQFSLSLSIR